MVQIDEPITFENLDRSEIAITASNVKKFSHVEVIHELPGEESRITLDPQHRITDHEESGKDSEEIKQVTDE